MTATAPTALDALEFDPSVLALPIPEADGLKAEKLTIRFVGVCDLDRTSLEPNPARDPKVKLPKAVTSTMTYVGLDVHARATHAAAIDVATGELRGTRFGGGSEEVVAWLSTPPQPLRGSRQPATSPARPGLASATSRRQRATATEAWVLPASLPRGDQHPPGDGRSSRSKLSGDRECA